MKIFISYRRDDTAGRAGRLFDVLATRYGDRNVFQDVTAIAPGSTFDDQVDAAIRSSDVVLVMIGPRWLGGDGAGDTRRIDQPDDYVRSEVRAALDSGVRVVPVLVEGAGLPGGEQLPDDLAPLLRRQAVHLRDDAWHRDVDELLRALEGRPTGGPARRSAPIGIVVGALAVGVIVGLAALAVVLRDGDSTGDALPECDEGDPSTPVAPAEGGAVDTTVDGRDARVVPESFRHWPSADGEHEVEVSVAVTNTSRAEPDTFEDDLYVSEGSIDGLLVDGIRTARFRCVGSVGDQNLAPGEQVVATFRFVSEVDPSGRALVLALNPDITVPIGTG